MKLYVIISNNGDGSGSVHYTTDTDLIDEMEKASINGKLDYERWADGDGFHYDTLEVPDGSTEKSLGTAFLQYEDVFYEDF